MHACVVSSCALSAGVSLTVPYTPTCQVPHDDQRWWHDDDMMIHTYLVYMHVCLLLTSQARLFNLSHALSHWVENTGSGAYSPLSCDTDKLFFSFCCMLFFAFVHCLYVCSAQSTICSFSLVCIVKLKQTTVHVAVYEIEQAKLTLQFLLLFFGLFLFLYTQVHTFMKYLVSVYSISVWLYPQASQATFSQGWETVLSILNRMRVWCI